jgi:hypothetical protein
MKLITKLCILIILLNCSIANGQVLFSFTIPVYNIEPYKEDFYLEVEFVTWEKDSKSYCAYQMTNVGKQEQGSGPYQLIEIFRHLAGTVDVIIFPADDNDTKDKERGFFVFEYESQSEGHGLRSINYPVFVNPDLINLARLMRTFKTPNLQRYPIFYKNVYDYCVPCNYTKELYATASGLFKLKKHLPNFMDR